MHPSIHPSIIHPSIVVMSKLDFIGGDNKAEIAICTNVRHKDAFELEQ